MVKPNMRKSNRVKLPSENRKTVLKAMTELIAHCSQDRKRQFVRELIKLVGDAYNVGAESH